MPAQAPINERQLRVEVCERIAHLPADAWNRLVADNHPFLRHEFLAALETHGCVGEQFGWLPRHLALFEGEELVAAMPLYEKHNNYGEFVFDHSWADAYRRSGLRYYPKLVSAIPYTPATGQRLLCSAGQSAWAWPLLLKSAMELAKATGASGLHCLFPEGQQQDWLESYGLLTRHDCQYHWHNPGYRDFDDFLDTLTNRKRKNIRQERRRVRQAGVALTRYDGHTASEAHWRIFTDFYNRTFEQKWGIATLNLGFFQEVAERMPDQVVLVLAEQDGKTIAGALMYRSDKVLYGRHWGCSQQVNCLHFEACYYQGIEYAIEQGLEVFEPGAQGEHKIARGFTPTLTRSSHWLADDLFHDAIEHFCQQERAAVADYMAEAEQQLPYKREITA